MLFSSGCQIYMTGIEVLKSNNFPILSSENQIQIIPSSHDIILKCSNNEQSEQFLTAIVKYWLHIFVNNVKRLLDAINVLDSDITLSRTLHDIITDQWAHGMCCETQYIVSITKNVLSCLNIMDVGCLLWKRLYNQLQNSIATSG